MMPGGLCGLLLREGAAVVCALMTVTAYDDSGGAPPWGLTASMTRTRPGVAACGPSWPWGTVMVLEGGSARGRTAPGIPGSGRVVECEDRGAGVGDRDVDLWMPTRRAALEFGRRGIRAIIFVQMGPTPGKRAATHVARRRWRGTFAATWCLAPG